MLVGALIACDGGTVERLETRVADLEGTVERLESRNRVLDADNAALEATGARLRARIDELMTTESQMLATGTEALASDELDAAEEAFQTLLARYPNGDAAPDARSALATIDARRAESLVGEAAWYAQDGQFENARAVYQQVVDGYPDTPSSALARTGLADLDQPALQQAAVQAGFVIEGVETFWRSNRDTLGGRSLIQPEVRFYVRPVGDAPIDYLTLRAVFYTSEDGSVEEFGDGDEYLVGSGDTPIQAGVRKQARIRSGVGYVDNGFTGLKLLDGGAPDTRVDLYFRTSFGSDWVKLLSLDVSKEFQL